MHGTPLERLFSAQFSETFLGYLMKEYDEPSTKKMLMDDFHIKHIDELRFRLVKYTDDILQEFDTVEDVIAFDPEFIKYRDRLLSEETMKGARFRNFSKSTGILNGIIPR